ncbi:metal ABC transporter ATP-binding protein [Parachlamydia sp. AcF125]|uniref:metal ABC transporter ATP-binding protein n=1 Tax=Parachlamydia sp. AcF125 TaxID=2795736 RepID=UPI001BC9B1B1|nr:metal ABC transporter ATP-binding protein [Parachlamydia sp. AcF125]MBS4167910.1 Fe(3+) dicitrate transport ATP-binding protein FecE [Parachlamydia sp. AcF125]
MPKSRDINLPNALEASQLTVNYDKTPVLWDISLKVPKGQLVGIIGPNGAGKTTFLKACLGLLKPLSGKISFLGEPLGKVRLKVAYVPQKETVDWDFPITVKELVLMGRYGALGLCHKPTEADKASADRHLGTLGMSIFADRQINQLSGGQKQRVFLARALIQDADVYLMDEPFTGIDIATEKVIIDLLQQLKKQGKTVFVVHHDLNTVRNYFDWVILLNMRLVAAGPTEEVFTPENLHAAYGKSYALFDEALKISQQKTSGMS